MSGPNYSDEMATQRGQMTLAQTQRILRPVAQDRILAKQGLSYVPAEEVRAELTRIFGAGNWDSRVHDKQLIYEYSEMGTGAKSDTLYWLVCYSVAVTLRVRDYYGNPIAEFTEYHAEENAKQPNRGEAHVLSMTSASSYALRRCAMGLGDAFGLHLYAKGSLDPLIKNTLSLTDEESPLRPTYVAWREEQQRLYDEHQAKQREAQAAQQAGAATPQQAIEQQPQQDQPDQQAQEEQRAQEQQPPAQAPQQQAQQRPPASRPQPQQQRATGQLPPQGAPAQEQPAGPPFAAQQAAQSTLAAGFNHPEGRQA